MGEPRERLEPGCPRANILILSASSGSIQAEGRDEDSKKLKCLHICLNVQ